MAEMTGITLALCSSCLANYYTKPGSNISAVGGVAFMTPRTPKPFPNIDHHHTGRDDNLKRRTEDLVDPRSSGRQAFNLVDLIDSERPPRQKQKIPLQIFSLLKVKVSVSSRLTSDRAGDLISHPPKSETRTFAEVVAGRDHFIELDPVQVFRV